MARAPAAALWSARCLHVGSKRSPVIGHDKASAIAHSALDEGTSLKVAALKTGWLDDDSFDAAVNPRKMARPASAHESWHSSNTPSSARDAPSSDGQGRSRDAPVPVVVDLRGALPVPVPVASSHGHREVPLIAGSATPRAWSHSAGQARDGSARTRRLAVEQRLADPRRQRARSE